MTDRHTHYHTHHHYSQGQKVEARCEVMRRLDTLDQKLDLIHNRQEAIMTVMDDLNAAVQRNTDAEAGVVTLLQGISQQLKDAQASHDPAAIQAVITRIDANTAAAAAAVVANTPAA